MSAIRLVTDVPGPRSRSLAEVAKRVMPHPLFPHGTIYAAGGVGAVLEDVDGNRFIDFIGGVGCLVVGHNHPRVVQAVKEQAGAFTHTDFSLIPYESYLTLAERISTLCGQGYKTGFFNSGAEAVENAVKVAKRATGRSGIICFEGAFHGRTYMAMTLTFREIPYKEGFGPFAQDVHRAPYPGFAGATAEAALADVERLLADSEIGGVIVEPVLGEGGFIPAPKGFLEQLHSLCRRSGALLIADEVQTGYCRSGTFLAVHQSGVEPDIIILGKSIAAGLPLSAVVAKSEHIDTLPSNSLGGTYVGNPVACTAGLAVLDVIEEADLSSMALRVGDRLRERWQQIAARSAGIVEVRGPGAMVGVEFADARIAETVVQTAFERGVLSMRAGPDGRVIRHLMPLVIDEEQIDEALDVFDGAI